MKLKLNLIKTYQEFLHIFSKEDSKFLNKVYQAISDKQEFEVIQKSFYQVRTLNGCTPLLNL
jgi:CRISPR/Cas system endoribonuclease Cas6 (RAMP superfamily)